MTPVPQVVSNLAVPYTVRCILTDAGYKHLTDLQGLTPDDLATETGIALYQAELVVEALGEVNSKDDAKGQPRTHISLNSPIKALTAADLLSTIALPRFSTLSHTLDVLIAHHGPAARGERTNGTSGSGGIVPGMAVEISGPPGSGKTSVGLGLALSVRDGARRGHPEVAEVLIIDTEGGLLPPRLRAAAEALSPDGVEAVLSGIHLVRIATQVEMIAFLHTLDEWLDSHPKVQLVIFDTLSCHFRQPNMDMNARRRLMDMIKERIGRMTTINRCAVVSMNQLATKLLTAENKPANFETGDRAVLMPQLGDTWTTSKTIRLVLFRGGYNDDMRYAHASSAGSDEEEPWAKFDISPAGLPCDFADPL